MKSGLESLNEEEARAMKLKSMVFMKDLDKGNGVNKHEFLLAVLEHQGKLDYERDIAPWYEVRNSCFVLYGNNIDIIW